MAGMNTFRSYFSQWGTTLILIEYFLVTFRKCNVNILELILNIPRVNLNYYTLYEERSKNGETFSPHDFNSNIQENKKFISSLLSSLFI